MSHTNCDIRLFTCEAPLGMTTSPITPVKGKGSRLKHKTFCVCGSKISGCGQSQFKEGRYRLYYAIKGIACCSTCWMAIYDTQGDEE